MAGLPELWALYQTYLEDTERVERERKTGEGLFGIGKKPSGAPCHESFAVELETPLKKFDVQSRLTPLRRAMCCHTSIGCRQNAGSRSAHNGC